MTEPQDNDVRVDLVVIIKPLPGRRDDVLAALARSVPKVHDEPGCERYAVHLSGSNVVIVERWSSEANARAHAEGEVVQQYRTWIAGMTKPSDVHVLSPIKLGDSTKGSLA